MEFSEVQRRAITHRDGPMMVLAGPGSGKTTVITRRVEYLVRECSVNPGDILVITFTRAAASEMRERCEKLGGNAARVSFGTFHAVFFHILKLAYRFTADSIIREDRQRQLLREMAERHHLDPEDMGELVSALLGEISTVKSEQMNLAHFYSATCADEVFREIYREYDEAMRREGLIDFDDMMVMCLELFRERKDILAAWQRRYRYILIDEFQDINRLQYEIIRMMALPEGTREGFVGSFASGFNGFSFCWLADDCLLVPKSGQPALWHPADVEGLTILRLASYDTTSWSWLSEAVRDFNDQSADVKIDLINYADFDTGNATVNGLSRLNTDILSGYTPDIFDLNTLPARSYENKGLIEDLWPWVDADPEIDRENLLPEVIRLLERDGKLYDLVPTYRLRLVCGSKEQFGDKESLSMDDLFALAEQYDAQQLFGCMNRREFWKNVLHFAGADFVNYDAPSCRFDSREFIRLLELSKGLSSKEEQDMSPEEWMEYLTLRNETTQRLVSGEQIFYFLNLDNMPVFMLQQADAIFRGEPRFVGFPSDSGSGIALEPFLRLGMSSASPNKEAVWEFFRFLLSDGYLTREKWNETPGESYCLMCIPTTRSAFDFRMSVWLENQFSVNASEYGNPDQEIVAGPETGARILALTAQSSSLYEYDQALLDMILDAAGAYYAGDRSAEDVAKLIQSKANLYLSEQYG